MTTLQDWNYIADTENVTGELEILVLIGSDNQWTLVTGGILRGTTGPMAVETELG